MGALGLRSTNTFFTGEYVVLSLMLWVAVMHMSRWRREKGEGEGEIRD